MLEKLDSRIDFLLRKAIRQAGYSQELARAAEIEWRGLGSGPAPISRFGTTIPRSFAASGVPMYGSPGATPRVGRSRCLDQSALGAGDFTALVCSRAADWGPFAGPSSVPARASPGPVTGPIAVGHSCHFGLGLFLHAGFVE